MLQPAKWAVSKVIAEIESGAGLTCQLRCSAGTFTSEVRPAPLKLASTCRAFSPYGILSSGWLGYAGSSSGGPDSGTRVVRLDTTYSFADVNTMFRYAAGDFITGGLAWTRPVHIAGFQVRKDFGMRPDLVMARFPCHGHRGSAAVPSTVNILADGYGLCHQLGGRHGPFEAPPSFLCGDGGARQHHDGGRQRTGPAGNRGCSRSMRVLRCWRRAALLCATCRAGWVRRNWGVDSSDYGKNRCGSAMLSFN